MTDSQNNYPEFDEGEIEKFIEENAEKIGEEFERVIDENVTNRIPKFLEPLLGVIFMLILLLLVNYFYEDIWFLTDDFETVLPVWNAAVIIGIFLNLARVFIHGLPFKIGTDVINTIVMFYLSYQLWVIYPFDISGFNRPELWDFIFKAFIILPPLAQLIGIITDVNKLNSQKEKKVTED